MRLSITEKEEVIRLVEGSDRGVNHTLGELGIHKSTFYKWYRAYLDKGAAGLAIKARNSRQWNAIPEGQKQLVEVALEHTALSPRELAVKITDEQGVYISESSVYRILKAKGLITTPQHILLAAGSEFNEKTSFVHQMWQTDFTYFKILGWGWYYLSTILDDYSRYIIHWELCKTMKAEDVQRSIEKALQKTGFGKQQRPRLLSDNGACYISSELKDYLESCGIQQVHGKVNHPQTQGKIERYHRSMKNVVKLDHYFCPEELQEALQRFVQYYNYQRYHESLGNVTPADMYWGRQEQILKQRQKVKAQTMQIRRRLYLLEKLKI
jgi:transposase InsO family protein